MTNEYHKVEQHQYSLECVQSCLDIPTSLLKHINALHYRHHLCKLLNFTVNIKH